MALPVKKSGAYTYADYLRWPDEERIELIDGVAYGMTPAPATRHQEIVLNLAAIIREQLRGKPCRVFVAPFDVRLPNENQSDEDVTTVVQPDVVVVCDRDKIDSKGCRGAPDFVIEVASPSSTAVDQIVKARLYERHGVKEYWIVHPDDEVVYVRRLGSRGGYGKLVVVAEGVLRVRAVSGLAVNLAEVFVESWAVEPVS